MNVCAVYFGHCCGYVKVAGRSSVTVNDGWSDWRQCQRVDIECEGAIRMVAPVHRDIHAVQANAVDWGIAQWHGL